MSTRQVHAAAGLHLRFRLAQTLAALAAAALLVGSLYLPWWTIRLNAPQYPGGLRATAYLTHLTGDVDEIDELNHYIGMMKLGDAAALEKSLVVYLVPAMALLALLSIFCLRPWNWLLRAPLILFPLGFIGDLAYWLWRAGHSLDPKAALSSAVKAFTPAVLGHGAIAQFSTDATVRSGFWLAATGAMILLLLPWLEKRLIPKGR